MKSLIITIRNLIRFNNWWHSKASLLMGITYWSLSLSDFSVGDTYLYVALILVWIFASASIGHFINDWFDAEFDFAAGKPNSVRNFSTANRIVIISVLLFAILIPAMLFAQQKIVLLCISIQLLLFFAYSHPAIRLKEKLWAGVLTDTLYAFILPVLIIIKYVGVGARLSTYIYFAGIIWLIAQGVRNILLHQAGDFDADTKTGVKTLATILGQEYLFSVINYLLLPAEMAALACIMIFVFPFTVALVAVILILWITLKSTIMMQELKDSNTWKSNNHPSFALLNNFYEQVLPLCFLMLLIIKNPVFIFLLCLHLLLFVKPLKDLIQTFADFFSAVRQHKI